MINKLKNTLSNLGIVFLSGFLYAFAGSDNTSKQIRRIGLPVLYTVFLFIILKNPYVLSCMLSIFSFYLGYGSPDKGYPEDETVDEGSAIGRFWFRIFKKNELWTNIFTRATVALAFCTCFISVPIILENWIIYIISSLILVILVGNIAWRGFGKKTFIYKNKTYTLLYVDIVMGMLYMVYVISLVIK